MDVKRVMEVDDVVDVYEGAFGYHDNVEKVHDTTMGSTART